ncbi:hypothetical protein [uncultured Rhodoblastus sp.]|uniref:hypothetical protein n=1 Tax=uncultured Rhodoblastus sp. TaxID=543037 RepID=UPI0025E631B4|nr:hypothetical protein [uncultured Rhodoblastus sp.]
MTTPLSFFSWWEYKKAPLGLALQWIVSESDTLEPFAMEERPGCASDTAFSVQNVNFDGPGGGASYGISAELAGKWDAAIKKLMDAIRDGVLQVYGLKEGDDTVSQLSIDLFDEVTINIISPVARDDEIFQNIIRPRHSSLEFGDYEKWPQCDGDIIRRDGELSWTRLHVLVGDIINIKSSSGPNEIGAPAGPSITPEIIYRTGAAGKPSSWWLIEQEVRGRFSGFPVGIKKSDIARLMNKWIKETHPEAPPITEKTIGNNLVALLVELRALPESA